MKNSPSIEVLHRLGTRTTVPSLQSETDLTSDLYGGSSTAAEQALSAYENAVGEKERLVVQTVCDAWQANLYCSGTAPLFHAAFDTPQDVDLSLVNPPGCQEETLCNPFTIEVAEWAVQALHDKISQERKLFREAYGNTITLFRGLSPHYSTEPVNQLRKCAIEGGEVTHKSNPLTSWTFNPKTAEQYASGGVVLERRFPVEDIVFFGPFNPLPGSEFIVNAGEHTYKSGDIHDYTQIHAVDQWFRQKSIDAIRRLDN